MLELFRPIRIVPSGSQAHETVVISIREDVIPGLSANLDTAFRQFVAEDGVGAGELRLIA